MQNEPTANASATAGIGTRADAIEAARKLGATVRGE